MKDMIWEIASQHGAGWFSSYLGYMELFYPTTKDKLEAEARFLELGYTVIQGTKYWSEPELNTRCHRIFSTI